MATFGSSKKLPIGSYGPPFFPMVYSLSRNDAANHGHVIGKSKSGKSRFLANHYINLLKAGYSSTLIDPHGDLAKLIFQTLVAQGYFKQKDATKKLIYLDFAQAERLDKFMPFNILNLNLSTKRKQPQPHKVSSLLKEACHRAWPELAMGAATFDTLLPDAATLLMNNQLPLICLHMLLTNDAYRGKLLERETDYFLASSFRDIFEEFKKPDQIAYAGSVLRRARQLTQIPLFKYGFGQAEMKLNFRTIIDDNVSVIINLGGLDQEVQGLIGCLLTVMLEKAAEARAELDAAERLSTHIAMIDEFHLFSAQSEKALDYCLSQSRKFGLYLVLCHQTWSQASDRLKGALSNADWEAIFRSGYHDARYSAPAIAEFDPLKTKREEGEDGLASFQSLSEQMDLAASDLSKQRRRAFTFVAPDDSVRRLKTLDMPDPKVDKEELGRINRYYLDEYFTHQEVIEPQILAYIDPERLRAKERRAAPAHTSFWEKKDD